MSSISTAYAAARGGYSGERLSLCPSPQPLGLGDGDG